ncbi:MAG: type I DNA topoisomerase [Bacteroidales bacterium]|nr:type I DNA topoisomerase [Bacteroidales bacterium]
MVKNLVIVESPAKAKTIERFLGKDFLVKSSFGHVMDLSKKQLGVDIENDFMPNYEISSDKKKIVSELKKLAKEAETVWLASDEDREGEAISWHLANALKLDEKKSKRIVFHEITKTAIEEAIKNPRKIDIDLVNAQQARRVLDRLVGFELSPVLWRKVKPALSAGRVQSVAVRLIVEREEEIKNFISVSNYKITADFKIILQNGEKLLKAELPKRFSTKEEALEFLNKCKAAEFSVASIEKKPAKKSPAAPFTTSTLQQEASRKLGFSVANTMRVAQKLYESGKITYMRTDSVNLSNLALSTAKNEITSLFGEKYVKTRKYKTKAKGAQEAHEAIRPTFISTHEIEGDSAGKKLYNLIWKRTIASQMSDAVLEKTNVSIDISTTKENLVAKGEVIKFDGFLKVYLESSDDENSENQKGLLPPLEEGEKLNLQELIGVEKFSQHPPRYSEASLVKKMEELGIGRPSTYAPTISTIQKREYIVKEDREGKERKFNFLSLKDNKITETEKIEKTGYEKSKLFPTDIGTLVNKFLVQYFENILNYNFTANIEREFDEIAEGQKIWNEVIKEFYSPFHSQIEDTLEKSKKFSGEKLLGKHPETEKNIFVKIGRYGPMVQLGDTDSEEKPKFAGLRNGQSIETITLEEALDLFKFPRNIGTYENEEMLVAIGRFGPYVKHKSLFYSLAKTDDPNLITKERAFEVIEEKRKKVRESLIKEFKEDAALKILKGRWGPYISYNKKNYKIPKSTEPETLTFDDCKKIIGSFDSKTTTKKATGKKSASKKSVAKKTTATKAPAKKVKSKKATSKKTEKK